MFKNKNKVSVDMNCLIETLNKIENRLLEISGIIFYEKRLIRNFEDVKVEMHDLKEQVKLIKSFNFTNNKEYVIKLSNINEMIIDLEDRILIIGNNQRSKVLDIIQEKYDLRYESENKIKRQLKELWDILELDEFEYVDYANYVKNHAVIVKTSNSKIYPKQIDNYQRCINSRDVKESYIYLHHFIFNKNSSTSEPFTMFERLSIKFMILSIFPNIKREYEVGMEDECLDLGLELKEFDNRLSELSINVN